MVVISIITGVIALLYFYNNRGWKFFNKAFQVGTLQTNAKSALDTIVRNVRRASKDLVYVGQGFNLDVPLPEDAIFGRQYLYFAVPKHDDENNVEAYDYFLYYIAPIKIKEKFDDQEAYDKIQKLERQLEGRAKIKLLAFRDQSKSYTEDFERKWPFLPPILELGVNKLPADFDLSEDAEREDEGILGFRTVAPFDKPENKELERINLSFLSDIEADIEDATPEFSLYQSDFFFDFGNTYDSLFTINVRLYDPLTDTRVDFESSVTPRN